MYIDSHCHLDFPVFDDCREQLLADMRAAGVMGAIVPGVNQDNWQRVLHLARQHSCISPALGLHPYFIDSEDPLAGLESLIEQHHHQLVAVGEIGLDGAIETPADIQEPLFVRQLAIAKSADLPVIIHAHKSYDRVLKYLRQAKLPRGGVIHAFSGSAQQAQHFVELGFYLGIGGTITYPRAAKTRRVVAQLPLEHLLLETDSPDMPLCGQQGRTNTPLNIPLVAKELSKIKQLPLDVVASQTSGNCRQLFDLK